MYEPKLELELKPKNPLWGCLDIFWNKVFEQSQKLQCY